MTYKFTHPDDAEPGHEWVSDAGRPAKHLGGDWWAHNVRNGKWVAVKASYPVGLFTDKPKNNETEVWVNCYRDGSVGAHPTKNMATSFAFGGVIARVRVPFSWTEGRFDV